MIGIEGVHPRSPETREGLGRDKDASEEDEEGSEEGVQHGCLGYAGAEGPVHKKVRWCSQEEGKGEREREKRHTQ